MWSRWYVLHEIGVMVSVRGHFDLEQRGLEVHGVHLHAHFFPWYILLFQPRFAESRDAGPWMHGGNQVYGGLTMVMCGGAVPPTPTLFRGQLCF